MEIKANQIPTAGVVLEEELSAASFDLETDIIKFSGPVKVKAQIFKEAGMIYVDVEVGAVIATECSRCLGQVKVNLKKDLKLNYEIGASQQPIVLDPDIREEIILDYPVKFLCKPDCKGLCPKCGKNLNEGGCHCGTT